VEKVDCGARKIAAHREMYRWLLFLNAVLLGIAVLSLPYDYYTLLRLFTCPVLAYGAYLTYKLNKSIWCWLLGTLAVLYNPVFRIHLQRETWEPINLATAAFAFVVAWQLRRWSKADVAEKKTQN
jgi:hypothetical protein